MDLIERQAALAALCEDCKSKYHGECPHPASRCIEYRAISRIPAVEAEQKNGRWIDKPDEYYPMNIIRHCSECEWSVFKGNPLYDFGHWNYCPHCGARMDEESEVQE